MVTRAEQPGPPRIRVLGDDGPEVRALRHALDATGAEVVLDSADPADPADLADLADLTVAGLDDPLDVAGRVDQGHWLLVRMHGDEVLVGLMR